MPNPIKYNTSTESNSLKSGDFWIGTGDVSKGPTSNTGYWNGITPPAGGYTIYTNKASNGPSISVCSSDAELISLTNKISGGNYTTVEQCLEYFDTQSDKMVVNYSYPTVTIDGLILSLDAKFIPSYRRSGTIWKDLSGGGSNGSIINGVSFNQGSSEFSFDGIDDRIDITNPNYPQSGTDPVSIEIVFKVPSGVNWYVNGSGTGLIGRGGYGGSLGIIRTSAEGNIQFWVRLDGGNIYNPSVTNLSRDIYHHIIGTYDGIDTAKVYHNGKFISQEVNSNNSGTFDNSIYRLGGGIAFGGNQGGYGAAGISKIAVYNKALSQQEVLQNYYQSQIQTSGLSSIVDVASLVSNSTSTTVTDLTSNKYVYNYEGTVTTSQDFGGTLRLNSGRLYRNVIPWYGNYTFGFWVKMIGTQSGMFYTESNRGPSGCSRVYSPMNSNGTFRYQVWDNSSISTFGTGNRSITSTSNVQDGNWHFITCIWSNGSSNRSRGLYLFVDGELEATIDMIGNDGAYSSFHLGGASGCVGTTAFNCYLGPYMQYSNLAMDDNQVLSLYNSYQIRFK